MNTSTALVRTALTGIAVVALSATACGGPQLAAPMSGDRDGLTPLSPSSVSASAGGTVRAAATTSKHVRVSTPLSGGRPSTKRASDASTQVSRDGGAVEHHAHPATATHAPAAPKASHASSAPSTAHKAYPACGTKDLRFVSFAARPGSTLIVEIIGPSCRMPRAGFFAFKDAAGNTATARLSGADGQQFVVAHSSKVGARLTWSSSSGCASYTKLLFGANVSGRHQPHTLSPAVKVCGNPTAGPWKSVG